MAVAGTAGSRGVEALRHDQIQMVLRPRHRHIEQAAFLLDFLFAAGRHVRRQAAIDDMRVIAGLQGNASAKRALWPRLRALRKQQG